MVYSSSQDFLQAAIGGVIIAMSTSLVLYTYGRICGLSGIFGQVLKLNRGPDFDWKAAFFTGFIALPVIMQYMYGTSFPFFGFTVTIADSESTVLANNNLVSWFLGGFLVGFGTKMGNGCTSGHGVCGLPRFSKRSLAAVCSFISAGMLVAVTKSKFSLFMKGDSLGSTFNQIAQIAGLGMLAASSIYLIYNLATKSQQKENIIFCGCGALFSLGLMVSGMCRLTKVVGFLNILGNWDPSLMFVMGGAVLFNLVAFKLILAISSPRYALTFSVPAHGSIDSKLVIGSAIFGMGWGLSGFCPGPALVNVYMGSYAILFVGMFALGHKASEEYDRKFGNEYEKM